MLNTFVQQKFESKVSKNEQITNGLSHNVVTGTILFNVIMTCKHNLTKLRMLKQHSLQIKQFLGPLPNPPKTPTLTTE